MYLLLFWMSFTDPSGVTPEPRLPEPPRISPLQAERLAILRDTSLLLSVDGPLAAQIAIAIQESCAEFDVDPKLMLALIYVESSGNPKAISKVGARGLTQIMPATGEDIAEDLGVPWSGPDMLYDIRTNIRFGTYYMSTLLHRFNGKKAHAVASYNWGPATISRRLRNGEALPTRYSGKVLRTHKRLASL